MEHIATRVGHAKSAFCFDHDGIFNIGGIEGEGRRGGRGIALSTRKRDHPYRQYDETKDQGTHTDAKLYTGGTGGFFV